MKPKILYLLSFVVSVMPETRAFTLKRKLYRLAGISIGESTRICSSCTFLGTGNLKIGDDCWIGHKALIVSGSQVTIGHAVDIAPLVYIGTGTHDIGDPMVRAAGPGKNDDIVIGDGAWLGVRSCVLPGVTVGKHSIIAAGAVVTTDVPDRTVVAGVPAKVVKSLDNPA